MYTYKIIGTREMVTAGSKPHALSIFHSLGYNINLSDIIKVRYYAK